MTPNKRWIWVGVALQVLILLGMVGRHAYTLATGTPVVLKTAPVDPWDPLRGEYVVLNYDISRFHANQVPMEGVPYRQGQQVWVKLKEGKPFWTAASVSVQRPATGSGEVAVLATVQWYNQEQVEPPTRPGEQPWPRLGLRYGIEQFYVPEGEGRDLERRRAEMTVEAVVDRFGRAALNKVFLDGKEIKWQ